MDLPPEAFAQNGRFSYAQARAFGMSRRTLARAVGLGLLVEVRSGVYAASDAVDFVDPVQRHRATVLDEQLGRGNGWAAARRSAAFLMGLPLIGSPPTKPQLVRDAGTSRSHGGDRHARVGRLPSWQQARYDGMLLSSPARAVVDIARAESFRNAVVVADGALRRDVGRDDLEAVLDAMPRWPGVARARRAVAFADGRAESPGESLTRVALHACEMPSAEPQVEIVRDGVVVARVDLLIHGALLVVEFHGAIKFTDAGVLPALLDRQEVVRSCGVDVLNTDWDETFGDPRAFAARVASRLEDRGSVRLARGVEPRSTVVRPVAPSLRMPKPAKDKAA